MGAGKLEGLLLRETRKNYCKQGSINLGSKDKVKVSVVIPTFNRAALLHKALKSILEQDTNTNFELVVVDDGSMDETTSLLRGLQAKTTRLRFVSQPNRGSAAARNRGIELARADIVAFMDDDCAAEPGWIDKISSGYETEPKLAATAGLTTCAAKDNVFSKYLEFKSPIKAAINSDGSVVSVPANNCSFSKNIITKAGGFNPDIPVSGGQDIELCQRLAGQGYVFRFQKDARVTHYHPLTARGFMRRSVNKGRGLAVTLEYLPASERLPRFLAQVKVLVSWILIPFAAYGYIKRRKFKPSEALLFACIEWAESLFSFIGALRESRRILFSRKDNPSG